MLNVLWAITLCGSFIGVMAMGFGGGALLWRGVVDKAATLSAYTPPRLRRLVRYFPQPHRLSTLPRSATLLLLHSYSIILFIITISLGGVVAQVPGRAITIIVPYSPASGPDILARTIGDELQLRWQQPVVIDNKPGASGNIGTQAVARARPDGHTVIMVSNPFTANTSVFKNVPYDPVKSFTPILQVATGSLVLALHPSVPAHSTKEFIEYVQARPGQLNYGSPGVGVPHHLAMELFKLVAKLDMKHVPYRGSAGATQDLLGGHVSAAFQAIHVALPLMQSNQLRLLAIASKERTQIAPELPTLAEAGLPVEVDLWYAMLAPTGTPSDIIARYNKEVNEIIAAPQIREKFAKQGLTVIGGTPEQLGEFIVKDIRKWQQVVKEAGITAE
jgi:tripartite-type tricarboxylate transporter receptor subunit TctC